MKGCFIRTKRCFKKILLDKKIRQFDLADFFFCINRLEPYNAIPKFDQNAGKLLFTQSG
ncbi:MAG: hypothetical protein LBL74_03550 [Bacteroidales bacterium]|jgi:hypothetical protein|nr:hypothetical protein [Bacteroidales bacterium]